MRVLILGAICPDGAMSALDIVACSAESGAEIRQAVANGSADVILLCHAAVAETTAILRELRAAPGNGSSLPILAMIQAECPATTVRLLDLGADDVITRDCEPEEIGARLRTLIRRANGHSRPTLAFGPLCIDMTTRQATLYGQPLTLTPREFEVMECLVLRRGLVITKEALFERLYDTAEGAEPNAVDVVVCRLRKKLQNLGAKGLIGTAWGAGYLLRSDEVEAVAA